MKWTKLALTTMTLGTFGMCFMACDPPPSPESESESELVMRSFHDGALFKLDRDAADLDPNGDPALLPDDWQTIHAGNDSAIDTTGIVADPAGTTTFTGGGSKDTQAISSWRRADGSVPDKNELTNAYAAAYINADGDFIIYFGADRFATDGDAFMGFWFFQDTVGLNNGTFSGQHTPDDLLVLVNFEQGGVDPVVQVLKWNPESANNLEVVAINGECNPSDATQTACALANNMTIDSFWPYIPKSGPNNTFAPGAFVEGAVNVSAIFDNAPTPCFATFMAETRSSTSVTATLKDFVLDEFQVCNADSTVTTACTAELVSNPENDGLELKFTFDHEVCNTSTGPGGANVPLHFTVYEDPGTPANQGDDELLLDADVQSTSPGNCPPIAQVYYPSSPSPFPPSTVLTRTLRVTVTDPSGNEAPVTKTVTASCSLCP